MTSVSPADAMRDFLSKHSVNEIEELSLPGGVVELDSTLSPLEGAKILWKHRILSAPVYDEQHETYLGLFEMRDILSYVVAGSISSSSSSSPSSLASSSASSSSSSFQNKHRRQAQAPAPISPLRRLLEGPPGPSPSSLSSRFETHMVTEATDNGAVRFRQAMPQDKTVSYFAARNPWLCCDETATLTTLVTKLSQKNCHRVPIVDHGHHHQHHNNDGAATNAAANGSSGRCTRIVSQGAIVRYLAQHLHELPALQQCPLIDSGLHYRKTVVSIVDTASAADAFTLLDAKHLTGIAVVDEDGKLVGNTSAQDIKLAALDEGQTKMDELDILSYLARVRQAHRTKKERHPVCRVTEQHTVSQIIDLLAKTGYHRVFVTNDDHIPIGVISITDLLKW